MADKTSAPVTAKTSAPASAAVPGTEFELRDDAARRLVSTLDNVAAFISTKMEIRGMKPYVAKIFIDRWDALTTEQRMMRVLEMPKQCYICGADGDSADGDNWVHFSPDPRVGYTKLYCSQCCLRGMLGADYDDDSDSEGWNEDEECHDEFSVGGASQPLPSSSTPPTHPHTFASALVLIDSPSSPLMVRSISRVFHRLHIPPTVCA